ncbi:MAG: hypothetical protein HY645_13410 [Acidobacteria bacterium]|nr:hypothetical protein [Acidobacteriota bacterium]
MRTLKEYRVVWEIELYACSPREAAQRALEIQRDADSIATVFDVYRLDEDPKRLLTMNEPVRVDLQRYKSSRKARRTKS